METSTILEAVALFIGTGGLAGFIVAMLTIRYERRKAKGEAHSAEFEGMKVEQDTYQELIDDLKTAWKEQKEYIGELHTDRRNLREERDELRKEIEKVRKEQQDQARRIASLGMMVEAMRPLICSVVGCKDRMDNIIGLVSDDSFEKKEDKSIEGEK